MKTELISQYQASLKMISEIIALCPDDLWNDTKYENAYWRIVYHTLFFASLYLSGRLSEFKQWENHINDYQSLGKETFDKRPIVIKNIYLKSDLNEYLEVITQQVDKLVDQDVGDNQCGFDWLNLKNTELHLYNIRHIQHHIGQLTERLHNAGITGVKWRVG